MLGGFLEASAIKRNEVSYQRAGGIMRKHPGQGVKDLTVKYSPALRFIFCVTLRKSCEG